MDFKSEQLHARSFHAPGMISPLPSVAPERSVKLLISEVLHTKLPTVLSLFIVVALAAVVGAATVVASQTVRPRVLGLTTAVPQSVSNLSVRADLVTYLYRCMLTHEPDQAGLDYWVGTMATDPDPVNHLYRAFYQSSDFNKQLSNTDFVTKIYQCVLFRQPNDPPDNNFSGRDFWANEMNSGYQTQSSMLEVFLGSPEYTTSILPKLAALPVSISVPTNPVTMSLSASPLNVGIGGTAYLSWSVANANSSSISFNNGIGAVAVSGNRAVDPTATTTYTLSASNSLGTVTKSVTVNVSSTSPVIVVNSPQLGEKWETNTAHVITWQTTNAAAGSTISIGLDFYISCLHSVPACSVPQPLAFSVASYISNNGSYSWQIPSNLSSTYQGSVTLTVSIDGTPYSSQSSIFNIAAAIVTPPPPPVNHKPIGFLDGVDVSQGLANGWSYDPDDTSRPVDVYFYIDGTDAAHLAGFAKADQPRPDVNQVMNVTGNHGFVWDIPAKYKDGQNHVLYAFGIDLTDITGASNTLLSGSPKTFVFSASPPPTTLNLDPRLSVTHASGFYPNKGTDFLVAGAQDARDLGFQAIEVYMAPEMCTPARNAQGTITQPGYYQTLDWCDSRSGPSNINPAYHSLGELAANPRYQTLFDKDFKTFIITTETINPDRVYPESSDCTAAQLNRINAFNIRADCYRNGFSVAQKTSLKNDFHSLTSYLLNKYKGTGKKFILQTPNEMENHVRGAEGGVYEDFAINNAISYWNWIQEAVDEAKAADPTSDVKVYQGCELADVEYSFTNTKSVLNSVVPNTHCDLYGWSAWDHRHHTDTGSDFITTGLNYFAGKAPDSTAYGSKNVYISELGAPEREYATGQAAQILNNVTDKALAWGVPYVDYWALYDNSCSTFPATSASQCPGFWLRKPATDPTQLGQLSDIYTQVFANRMAGSQPPPIVPLPPPQSVLPATAEAFVAQLYSCVLVRPYEQAGYDFWLNDFKTGKPVRDMFRAFFSSVEYQNDQVANQDFVTQLYNCVLYRAPDSAGYNSWLEALNNGWWNRNNELDPGFLQSAEFTTSILPRLEALQ